jgi:hypothetical protein
MQPMSGRRTCEGEAKVAFGRRMNKRPTVRRWVLGKCRQCGTMDYPKHFIRQPPPLLPLRAKWLPEGNETSSKGGSRVYLPRKTRSAPYLMVCASITMQDDTESGVPIGPLRSAEPAGFFGHAQGVAVNNSPMTAIQGNQYTTYVQGDRNIVPQSV